MSGRFELRRMQARELILDFSCGVPALDTYLAQHAKEGNNKRWNATWLALDGGVIAGYATVVSGAKTTWERSIGAPVRRASGSADPNEPSDEVLAHIAALAMVQAAKSANQWADAVRSWKEFRRGAT